MVPQPTDLRKEILREFHCSRFEVHPGGTKKIPLTRENSNFLKKCKMVISIENQEFSRSRMTKRTFPLKLSHKIELPRRI